MHRFCASCGIQQEDPDSRYCPSCGAANPSSSVNPPAVAPIPGNSEPVSASATGDSVPHNHVPARHPRGRLLAAVGAAVVLLVVVLVTVASGVVPGLRLPGSSTGSGNGGGPATGAISSSQALSAADTAARGYQNANWTPILEEAIVVATTSSLAVNLYSPCKYFGLLSVTDPGQSQAFTTGLSTFWAVVFNDTVSPSRHALFVVINGTASGIGVLTGPGCGQLDDISTLTAGGSLVTSSTAISNANAGGNVTSFLGRHSPTMAMFIVGGMDPAFLWQLFWCSYPPPGPAAPTFYLTWGVSAGSGAALTDSSFENYGLCSSDIGLYF